MIFGISGKINSGKDTIGKIIQYWVVMEQMKKDDSDFVRDYEGMYNLNIGSKESFDDFCHCDGTESSDFIIKKMADTLKDIVCLLINCTREQLENHEFKDTPLGEEWRVYQYSDTFYRDMNGTPIHQMTMCSKEKYEEEYRINWQTTNTYVLTPRLLLQLIGTECGRNIIHPNVWCNATFASYKPTMKIERSQVESVGDNKFDIAVASKEKPKWIITDVRFPNEVDAVHERNGKMIRLHRQPFKWLDPKEWEAETGQLVKVEPEHPSETALDDYKHWDYEVDNNGSIEELIEAIRKILVIEKVI